MQSLDVAGEIIQVGNDIRPSANGFSSGGRALLLQHTIPADGIVVAWTSYYRNKRPASYHIWRPLGGTNSSMLQLVREVVIVPTTELAEETVSGDYYCRHRVQLNVFCSNVKALY